MKAPRGDNACFTQFCASGPFRRPNIESATVGAIVTVAFLRRILPERVNDFRSSKAMGLHEQPEGRRFPGGRDPQAPTLAQPGETSVVRTPSRDSLRSQVVCAIHYLADSDCCPPTTVDGLTIVLHRTHARALPGMGFLLRRSQSPRANEVVGTEPRGSPTGLNRKLPTTSGRRTCRRGRGPS